MVEQRKKKFTASSIYSKTITTIHQQSAEEEEPRRPNCNHHRDCSLRTGETPHVPLDGLSFWTHSESYPLIEIQFRTVQCAVEWRRWWLFLHFFIIHPPPPPTNSCLHFFALITGAAMRVFHVFHYQFHHIVHNRTVKERISQWVVVENGLINIISGRQEEE